VGKTDLNVAPRQCAGSRVAPHPPHPSYSPDLDQADIFLFPKLKTTLKGRRFQTTEEIKENSIRQLRAITESAFQEPFQQWKKLLKQCIPSTGDYFEGDSAHNAVK
jgi:hypothetical protein